MDIHIIDALDDILIGTTIACATIVDNDGITMPMHDATLESMAGMLS